MFEAIHGSAPRRAGQNAANPSGLLQGAIMMLNHIGQTEVAEKVQNAWLKTLEDGIHTYDIFKEGTSKEKVGTKEFAKAVIANLGKKPSLLKPVSYSNNSALSLPSYNRKPAAKKDLVGVDVFVHWAGTEANELAEKVKKIESNGIKLSMITNRGIKVWPDGFKETFCTDHWRCRFIPNEGSSIHQSNIIEILNKAINENIDTIKTEKIFAVYDKKSLADSQKYFLKVKNQQALFCFIFYCMTDRLYRMLHLMDNLFYLGMLYSIVDITFRIP
jgi:isocitrate dehydrogenase